MAPPFLRVLEAGVMEMGISKWKKELWILANKLITRIDPDWSISVA